MIEVDVKCDMFVIVQVLGGMVAIRENWGKKKKMSPGHDFLACCHVGQLGI